MPLLIFVSLIWAFSFGLIGQQLADLPPAWTACVRLGLASLVFLPFVKRIPWRDAVVLSLIGAIQFGWMYAAYMASFHYLQSYEVALFTTTTPLFIVMLDDITHRRLHLRNLPAALLAVAGGAVILWKGLPQVGSFTGVLLVQLSNLLFAAGQLAYRAWMVRQSKPMPDRAVFFWLYIGGFAALCPLAWPVMASGQLPAPTPAQWGILLYLGVAASGICFFLWNKGARQVSSGTLAIMNNLKIPLAVAVSLCIFREHAGWATLLGGTLLLLAAFLPLRSSAPRRTTAQPPATRR